MLWGLTINLDGENLDGFLMDRNVLLVCMKFRCRMGLLQVDQLALHLDGLRVYRKLERTDKGNIILDIV